MDKMFVRVPVAIKAKVTEDLKLKIIGDVQNTIKTINLRGSGEDIDSDSQPRYD